MPRYPGRKCLNRCCAPEALTACAMKSSKPPASYSSLAGERACRGRGKPRPADQHSRLSIIGPGPAIFSASSAPPPRTGSARSNTPEGEYFKRIDALHYPMIHDDGHHVELEDADGGSVRRVPRTSKTPDRVELSRPPAIRPPRTFPLVPGIAIPASIGGAEKPAGGQSCTYAGAAHSSSAERCGSWRSDNDTLDRSRPSPRIRVRRRRLSAKFNWGCWRHAAIDRGNRRPAVLKLAPQARQRGWRNDAPGVENLRDPWLAKPRARPALLTHLPHQSSKP